MVYETNELPVSWDGTFREKVLLPGVYAYILRVEYLQGNTPITWDIYGDVTLVR